MKKSITFLITIALASTLHAQILTLQGGPSISKLNWELERFMTPTTIHDKTLVGYSVFAGMDYFDRTYFNISSNIGLIRKGGMHDVSLSEQSETDKLTLSYLSVNTTADFKYPVAKIYYPFVSIGPRLDYLAKHSQHFDIVESVNGFNAVSVGMILGAGVKVNTGNFQFGLRADYYLNFNPVADWENQSPDSSGKITGQTFTVSLSIGYKLNKGIGIFTPVVDRIRNGL
ncbi:MAG: PorT family protein [Bacteroidales bacterium]|jgi:hypothetical protein|nr:PorT family protein [Bacteroidales bacterium]